MSKIKDLLDQRYGLRTPRLHATVTAAPLVGGRSAGYVIATVGGVGGVRVNVSPDLRAPFAVGDTLVVDGVGTPAATEYWADGRIAGARADSDIYQYPEGGTVTIGGASTTLGAGDIVLGSTLTDMSNWWYQYELGRWQIRKGTLMHGAIGDLNGLYGYSATEYGTAFGQYSAGQVNITTDPTNGFRIRNYTTPVFQADTNGVVWALSTFRAGTGNDMVGITATDGTWRLYAGHATPASAPFRVDKAGALTATGATISGAITATSGTFTGTVNATAGYFGDGATRVTIEAAGINVGNTGSIRLGRTGHDTGTGIWTGYADGYYRLSAGVAGGREFKWDGVNLTVNSALITGLAAGSELTIQGWQCTCVFSATDADTVAWGAGVFTLADGTAYNIDAGNTGNMAARTYIYLNKAVSTTVLQKTTTASTAVGTGKVLLATAINSTTEALWQVFNGSGGVQIGGGQIEQRSITASEIATGTLTANEIAANTITASQIAANTITAGQIASATITTTQIAASTIVAANIATGTITADKLTVTAGGANLLLNSTMQVDANADSTADGWLAYNTTPDDEPTTLALIGTGGVDNRAYQRVSWSIDNTGLKGIQTYDLISGGVQGDWLPNTTYIISWYAKTSSINGTATLGLIWSTQPTTTTVVQAPASVTTSWQRWITRIVTGNSVEAYKALRIGTAAAVHGSLEFDHVQVEQADTPSAWKPFPSELEPGSVVASHISVASLAAIQVDTGALNLSGFLTIGAAGGIYQGTGTAGTPTTGLKVWSDGGIGRIAGYNATTLQWSADTDGKLYAGASAVRLDSDGITLASAVSGGAGSLKTKSGVKLIGEYYTGRDGNDDVTGGVDLFNYDATSNVTSSFGVYHSAGLSSRYVSASTPTTSINTIIGSKLVLNIRAATGTVVSLQDNFTNEYWALTNAGTMIGPAWKPATNSITALQMQKADGTNVLNVDTTNGRVGIGTAGPNQSLTIFDNTAAGANVGVYANDASALAYFKLINDNATNFAQLITFGTSFSATRFGELAAGGLNEFTAKGEFVIGTEGATKLYFGTSNLVRATVDASGNLGLGTTAPATKFHTLLTDAGTDAVVNVATLGHDTSGTAAAGFGAGLAFALESSTTAAQSAARITSSWYEATHASRKADLVLTAYDTAEREGLRIRGAGSAPAIGFYGATPVARATTAGAAATFSQLSGNAVNDASTFDGYTLLQVVKALRNIGVLT